MTREVNVVSRRVVSKALAAAIAAGACVASGRFASARPEPTAQKTAAAPSERPCDAADYRRMDFWLGRWDVFTPDGKLDGTNVIEKILGGCAILESWHDADGGLGKSLFYVDPTRGRWKQVWVTDGGALKEKSEVVPPSTGGVRFQGDVALKAGGTYLDRTTLTLLPDGRVRQTIEGSRDHGVSWTVLFDGMYVREKAGEVRHR